MADELSVVTFSRGGRPVEVFNLEDIILDPVTPNVVKMRDTFKYVPPTAQDVQTSGPGRWSGARTVSQKHDNGQVQARWQVKGMSAQETLDNVSMFLQVVKAPKAGRYLRWRANGTPYPTYFELRGAGTWVPDYSAIKFEQGFYMFVDASWPVAPLALWDQCDILDDFSVNTLGSPANESFAEELDDLLTGYPVVLHWPLGDSAGPVQDQTANNRDGTVTGVTLAAAGLLPAAPGTSAFFDATTDKIQSVAYTFANGGTHTLIGWAYRDNNTAQQRLVSFGTAGAIRSVGAGSNVFNFEPRFSFASVGVTLPASGLFMWAVKFNEAADTVEWFVNGVSQGVTTAFATQWGAGTTDVRLGDGEGWFGRQEHFTVVEGDVPSTKIAALYRAGMNGSSPGVASDYGSAFDSGAANSVAIAGGVMTVTGGVSTEKRARNISRGYKWLEVQDTRKFTPGPTITGFKGGVTLRDDGAGNRIEVYVDDNGTNSRLRIDVILASVVTNRASVNLAARIVNGTPLWVRGRIEGNQVYAEHFTSAPASLSVAAPTTEAPAGGAGYTLVDPTERRSAGWTGFTWIPKDLAATMDEFESRPYTKKPATVPARFLWNDEIPGTEDALVDLSVAAVNAGSAPIWALYAWGAYMGQALLAGAGAPMDVINASAAGVTGLSGWAATADANYRSGNGLKVTTAGVGTATAEWLIDPSISVPDDFTQGEVDIEVWARVEMASTLVTPKLTLSVRPDNAGFGATRWSNEYGSTGKLLTKPSSGTQFRPVRLGTVTAYIDTKTPSRWRVHLDGAWAAGSSGTFGVDQLVFVALNKRAASPTGRPNDAAFPKFIGSTSATVKTIRSDGSAEVAVPGSNPFPDVVGWGRGIEVTSGGVALFTILWLSNLVPDDPTADATTEQKTWSAAQHLAVWPRSEFVRGS